MDFTLFCAWCAVDVLMRAGAAGRGAEMMEERALSSAASRAASAAAARAGARLITPC